METECLERMVSNTNRCKDGLLVVQKMRLKETALEYHVQQVDLRIGVVMLGGVGVFLEIVGVGVNNNPAIGRLMLVHEDRTARCNQAK